MSGSLGKDCGRHVRLQQTNVRQESDGATEGVVMVTVTAILMEEHLEIAGCSEFTVACKCQVVFSLNGTAWWL